MAMLFPSCKQAAKQDVLVAYFSATGTTEAVAKQLADAQGATLYEIKPQVRYTKADLDWTNQESRSSLEMKDPSSRPAIVEDLQNAADYDIIFVGFPVWWYTAPTIINTFLDTYDFSGKTVVFFATSGGSDLVKANAQFKEQYPGINWKDGRLLNGATPEDIASFLKDFV